MNQGTEWGLLMKKNRSQKSRASVPLSCFQSIDSKLNAISGEPVSLSKDPVEIEL